MVPDDEPTLPIGVRLPQQHDEPRADQLVTALIVLVVLLVASAVVLAVLTAPPAVTR